MSDNNQKLYTNRNGARYPMWCRTEQPSKAFAKQFPSPRPAEEITAIKVEQDRLAVERKRTSSNYHHGDQF